MSDLITDSTPPPRQLPYPHQTPISFNTGSFVNTSENRKKHFDGALRDELDSSLYIDVPGFFDAFFGDVANLTSVADAIFRKCQGGKDPLYTEEGGWRDWPKDAKEDQVLKWLKELVDKLLEFAKGSEPVPNIRRRPLGLEWPKGAPDYVRGSWKWPFLVCTSLSDSLVDFRDQIRMLSCSALNARSSGAKSRLYERESNSGSLI